MREHLVPQLDALEVDAVLVMDNAGYHCTPAEGCVDPASWKNKGEACAFLQKYSIPFREGSVAASHDPHVSSYSTKLESNQTETIYLRRVGVQS
ncbi:hypothetical protein NFJ02_19g34620 [Pycnococcus provasolii]